MFAPVTGVFLLFCLSQCSSICLLSVHRCTRVENPGEGYGMFLPKFLGGVKGFRKNYQGGPPIFAFYCIFINKFFENLLGGVLFHTPPTPYPPPCVHLCVCLPDHKLLNVFALLFIHDYITLSPSACPSLCHINVILSFFPSF